MDMDEDEVPKPLPTETVSEKSEQQESSNMENTTDTVVTFAQESGDGSNYVSKSPKLEPVSLTVSLTLSLEDCHDGTSKEPSGSNIPVPDESSTKILSVSPSHLNPSAGDEKIVLSSDSTKENECDDMKNVHHIKWIDWSGGRAPIVTQNQNGPCPLLAIFNVLLLSRRILLGDGAEFISLSQILSRVADIIWEAMPQTLSDEERLNYEQNISDAICVFPNLQTGLDVNVKFDAVKSFEYTPELAVFDLLRIPLYHGWLVDPQDTDTKDILLDLSYNQAVEKVINCSSSEDPEEARKGLIAQEFLEATASQITYHGIVSLCEEMLPGSLAVLFRNNHFCTVHRHNDELFTLITDLGFLNEHRVVWESLSGVQGDSQFVDGTFLNSPPKSAASAVEARPHSTYLDSPTEFSNQSAQQEAALSHTDLQSRSDFLIAQSLQAEEDIAAQGRRSSHSHPVQRSAQSPHQHTDRNKKNDRCNIL